MKTVFWGLGGLLILLATVVAAHVALIEIGREVVVIHTSDASGNQHSRRLWVVDHDGSAWLHSAGDSWHRLFSKPREIELERSGLVARYHAAPVPGPHPAIDRLLREKYGLADRWVRLLAPCDDSVLVVRLDR